MIYFAYGSNMLTARLRRRVPSATVIGRATLVEHRLCWHKQSVDGSGKCDVLPTGEPSDVVFGVLFEIAGGEKPALDRAEGVGMGYEVCRVTVENGTAQAVAFTYRARFVAIDGSLEPYNWYKALVVAGAREHGLPVTYVEILEAQAARPDHDADRTSLALGILREGEP